MGTIKSFREASKASSNPSHPPPVTSSTARFETVNVTHDFKINGYSLNKGMGIGKYITSDTFLVGGYEWAIYFYPDGKSMEDNAAYVSIFIALVSDGADVRALFELTLFDQSGKGNHKVHSHFERRLESGPYTLKYRGSMWGYKRYFKRTLLESSDYLKDDCLSIKCVVGVVKLQTEGPKIYSITPPPSDIGQQFGKLLESRKCADVNFEVDGEIFAAHKLVIAARSPVFRAQLFGPLKDKDTRCIKVEDIEAPVFKALLHFMYWDNLPDMLELVGANSKWASTLMAQHLLAAADRYALDRLKLLCEAKLCEDIAINTVATTLALAEQHHCFQLKAACLRFIAMPENLKGVLSGGFSVVAIIHGSLSREVMIVHDEYNEYIAVMQSDGFDYLKESCPAVLTELLQYVARVTEHNVLASGFGNLTFLDGSDLNGRRVKQRLY